MSDFKITDAEFAAIAKQKAALKQAFAAGGLQDVLTYRSWARDTELLYDDYLEPGKVAGTEGASAGLLYAAGQEFIEDCYFERGVLEPLVKAYSGHKQWMPDGFDRLVRHLEAARRFDLIERFCTTVARRSRSEFFSQRYPGRDPADRLLQEYKARALETYAQAIALLNRIGRPEAAERLSAERDAMRDERFPELPPVSDLRRIDEPLFWELISRAKAQAETANEQLALLGEWLRAFKAAEIKRFGSIYARLMKKLYHWDVWALAYAARGGCSDDAFMEFRTWLILQGDPALVEQALKEPVQAARRVPADPELPDGTLLPVIEEAYLQREGSPVELPATDLDKPKGKEWPEEKFEAIYPELVRHYASVKAQ